jgi:4-amino-4-deoxy-L-arabinose transferase-like glycosyltransferase
MVVMRLRHVKHTVDIRQLASTQRREYLALIFIALFALALRIYSLDDIPTNITADESDNLRVVFRIEETGEPGVFGLDWKPQPAFSMYLAREFMRVFGDTPFGLRMPSAVLSVLALFPFYALIRRVVSVPAALAATALLATGRWYLHFSRSGWENVQTGCYALFAAWMLTVALEKGERRWFFGAGVAAALGLYGYFSGRFILISMLAYAPLAWWWSRQRGSRLILNGREGPIVVRTLALGQKRVPPSTVVKGFLIVAATAILLFVPQLRTIQKDWDYFNRRASNVLVFNQPKPYLGESTTLGIVRLQVERMVSGFIAMDSTLFNNGRYSPPGKSILDTATGILFLFGMALALLRWRATALWWLMLFVPLAGTQILTSNTPDAARAVMVAPFMYLFVGLSLDETSKIFPRTLRPVAYALLLATVVAVSVGNIRTYFDWIQSADAARVRGPSVEYVDYPNWRESIRCELRGGVFEVTAASDHECIQRPE